MILYSHASNYTKMYRDKYFNINYEIITFNIIFLKFFQIVVGLWVKEERGASISLGWLTIQGVI